MIFRPVYPREIENYWPIFQELLRPSFRYRVHTDRVEDYFDPLVEGDYQLWAVVDGEDIISAVVTCLEEGTNAKICSVLCLGGQRLKEWAHLMDETLTAFANENKCYAVEATTRKGFSRFIPNFVEDGVVYVKILGEKNGQD